MELPDQVEIIEVSPRDGFQNISEWIPTETKLEIIGALVGCGFKEIEVTAFVNPKAVPQMADAKEIVQAVRSKYPRSTFIALAPNVRGVRDALAAGAENLTYIVSASERHNWENAHQTIDQSLAALAEVCAEKGAARVRLAIPTAFNCPWTGKVPPETVIGIIERGLELGVDGVTIADTIGDAHPLQVEELLDILKTRFPNLRPALHLHDSYGMALANILIALQNGVSRFEASLGGIGGCPFAPGAAGNAATEDIVNMLEKMGIKTGLDLARVLEAADRVSVILPVPFTGRVLDARRRRIQNPS